MNNNHYMGTDATKLENINNQIFAINKTNMTHLNPGSIYYLNQTVTAFSPFNFTKQSKSILVPTDSVLFYLFNEKCAGYNNLHFLYQTEIWRVVIDEEFNISLLFSIIA